MGVARPPHIHIWTDLCAPKTCPRVRKSQAQGLPSPELRVCGCEGSREKIGAMLSISARRENPLPPPPWVGGSCLGKRICSSPRRKPVEEGLCIGRVAVEIVAERVGGLARLRESTHPSGFSPSLGQDHPNGRRDAGIGGGRG